MLANIFAMNLQTIIRLVGLAGFIAISILIWRFGRKSGWQMRAILYGWACLFSWELLCSALVPMWVADYVDRDMRKALFPEGVFADGQFAVATLFVGWFWPFVLVQFANRRNRSLQGA